MNKLLGALVRAAAPDHDLASASTDERRPRSRENDNCFPAASMPADGCYPRAETAADPCFPGPASARHPLRGNRSS